MTQEENKVLLPFYDIYITQLIVGGRMGMERMLILFYFYTFVKVTTYRRDAEARRKAP
jgi:hypothetical protein